MNMHACRILGNQPPQEIIEHKRDMTDVNMQYGMMKDRVIAAFSFRRKL
jgi:hypothetical protein